MYMEVMIKLLSKIIKSILKLFENKPAFYRTITEVKHLELNQFSQMGKIF